MNQSIATITASFPNNVALLNLYKIEKEQMDFPSSPFMPFKEWKEEYFAEWMESHVDSRLVDADEAITETDAMIKEADGETKVKAIVIAKPVKIKKIKVAKKVQPKEPKEKKVSKSDMAKEIYRSMMVGDQHPARKDVIDRFMKECDLSSAGASTYQFNIKKLFGG